MKDFIKRNSVISVLLLLQIIFLILKLTSVIHWTWYWVLVPVETLVTTVVAVALAGLTRGIIEAVRAYHSSKLYRIGKLPKPIVDGFLKGYLENEFEEQLKNFPKDRKDLN